jgi:tetratricopeptide (TPR) repeat protein
VEQASQDHFGLKVKLPNGNIANRVLPVRIHELDNSDIKECESVLGGVLRGIEFIYKESGIDKPLSPEDDEKKNLNNTKFRIQIIKVAHAVREIILGMKKEPFPEVKEKDQSKETFKEIKSEESSKDRKRPEKPDKWKLLSVIALVTALIIVIILAYPNIFKQKNLEKLKSSDGRISVAIMPFRNMTNDTTWNYLQNGIQFILITSLSNYSEELKVSQAESINGLLLTDLSSDYASVSQSFAGSIAKNLEANTFICGSINSEGSNIRLIAQLTNSETLDVYKSFQVDGTVGRVFPIIDSLSKMVSDFLIITRLNKGVPQSVQKIITTNYPEAFRNFIQGTSSFYSLDFATAKTMLLRALDIDSTFTAAMLYLSMTYGVQEMYEQAKKWCLKAYEKRDQLPLHQKFYIYWGYARLFQTPYEEIKYMRELIKADDQMPFAHYEVGQNYIQLNQYEKAITEIEKALEIYKKWHSKPLWYHFYINLGIAYHKTGQYKKEKELYKKAEQDFPGYFEIISRQTILALSEKDTVAANKFIDEYTRIRKENSASEEDITTGLAEIYNEAGLLNKAEEYYQKALSFNPEEPLIINDFAYFLIDKDRDLNEGMELADKALDLSPDNYNYLHTKGLGLYKQGKYNESLGILQKSWDIRMNNAIYDHSAFLHLEAAKKAVADH